MNKRNGYFLALTLIATTLCVGRPFAPDTAASSPAPSVGPTLVARLTKHLRRSVARRPVIVQGLTTVAISQPAIEIRTHCSWCIAPGLPQLPLPPPVI